MTLRLSQQSQNELTRGHPGEADRLGLPYRESLSVLSVLGNPPWIPFEPVGVRLYNVMAGFWRDLDVCVFDFEWNDTSERSTRMSDLRTAISISSESIDCPVASIEACRPIDRIASWFFKDAAVAETNDPDVKPEFVLDCDDPDWIGLDAPRLNRFLQDHRGWVIKLSPGKVAIHSINSPLEVTEIEDGLNVAMDLYQIITSPQDESTADAHQQRSGNLLIKSQRSKLDWLTLAMFSIMAICFSGFHLGQAWRQMNSSQFESTEGRMNCGEVDDFGEPILSTMQFRYVVNDVVYHGDAGNRRFVWRPIGLGDEEAEELEKLWRTAGRPTVFYDPHSPSTAVLDNTFTKGDSNLAKILFGIAALGVAILFWPLREQFSRGPRRRSIDFGRPKPYGHQIRIRLPRFPYAKDTAAFLIVPIGFFVLDSLALLVFGELNFLVTARLGVLILTGVNLIAIPFVSIWENHGRGGERWCLMVDPKQRTLNVPRFGRQSSIEIGFEQITRIRLRTSWYDQSTTSVMNAHDPILVYVDADGSRKEIVLARYFSRQVAASLVRDLKAIIDLKPPQSKPTLEMDSPTSRPENSDIERAVTSSSNLAVAGWTSSLSVFGIVLSFDQFILASTSALGLSFVLLIIGFTLIGTILLLGALAFLTIVGHQIHHRDPHQN